jgi:hypothetical protein
MAQLYANENFPLPVVEELRRLGHGVLTTYESGHAGIAIPDEEVLAFSIAEKRVLLTINRKHFVKARGKGGESPCFLPSFSTPSGEALDVRCKKLRYVRPVYQGKPRRIGSIAILNES